MAVFPFKSGRQLPQEEKPVMQKWCFGRRPTRCHILSSYLEESRCITDRSSQCFISGSTDATPDNQTTFSLISTERSRLWLGAGWQGRVVFARALTMSTAKPLLCQLSFFLFFEVTEKRQLPMLRGWRTLIKWTGSIIRGWQSACACLLSVRHLGSSALCSSLMPLTPVWSHAWLSVAVMF